MSSIARLSTMANVARPKEICDKVKRLALKPTPWTLSNLNLLGLSSLSTKRLESVFLRFLYQFEYALTSQSTDNNMRRYYKVYCHCPGSQYFRACLQNCAGCLPRPPKLSRNSQTPPGVGGSPPPEMYKGSPRESSKWRLKAFLGTFRTAISAAGFGQRPEIQHFKQLPDHMLITLRGVYISLYCPGLYSILGWKC